MLIARRSFWCGNNPDQEREQDMSSSVDTGGAPAGATVVSFARPVLHDFAYRTCAVCHYPIPPHQLVDDDYRPRHDSCEDGKPLAAYAVQKVA
jgi:hypothetical protein